MADTKGITGTQTGVAPTPKPVVNPVPVNEQASSSTKTQATEQQKNALGGTGTLGEQDFLTLLVNQLQNQDPLNPMDPKEFAGELAQFSQVEQLIGINKKLDGLGGASGSVGSMAGFLGREVVLSGDQGATISNGKGSNLLVDIPEGTQSARIDLIDATGGVAGSVNVDAPEAGQQVLSLNGAPVDNGTYDVRVVSVDGQGRFRDLPAKVTGTVEGFVLEPEPKLLVGGKQVGLEEVVEVYKGGNA